MPGGPPGKEASLSTSLGTRRTIASVLDGGRIAGGNGCPAACKWYSGRGEGWIRGGCEREQWELCDVDSIWPAQTTTRRGARWERVQGSEESMRYSHIPGRHLGKAKTSASGCTTRVDVVQGGLLSDRSIPGPSSQPRLHGTGKDSSPGPQRIQSQMSQHAHVLTSIFPLLSGRHPALLA